MSAPLTPALPSLPAGHRCANCDVRSVALCGVLGAGDLARLRCLGGTQVLRAGEPLFREGDGAAQVYSLTTGALRLTKLLRDGRRQVMGFVLPGDFLGITDGGQHGFTAEALEATSLCRFPRARFEAFVDEQPELGRALYRTAAHELAAAQAQVLLLGRKSAPERLASFLLDLVERAERNSGAIAPVVDLPNSRSDIADYLGLTKETISRVLALLRTRRLVRLESRNRVELLDREGLAALAAGEGGPD